MQCRQPYHLFSHNNYVATQLVIWSTISLKWTSCNIIPRFTSIYCSHGWVTSSTAYNDHITWYVTAVWVEKLFRSSQLHTFFLHVLFRLLPSGITTSRSWSDTVLTCGNIDSSHWCDNRKYCGFTGVLSIFLWI